MTVEIRVNSRPGWYQVTENGVDSDALADHLARLALAEWTRLRGAVVIVVTATERGGVREAVLRLAAWRANVRVRQRRRR